MNVEPDFNCGLDRADRAARQGASDSQPSFISLPTTTPKDPSLYCHEAPPSGPGLQLSPPPINADEKADKAQAVSYTCDVCKRRFLRHCDLNKHSRTHSRPFKCKVPSCKYYKHGWPTEKELERHYNDKHSSKPSTFACLFQPCHYTSKRESNCKQHMEKSHGWKYVRSRSMKPYRCPFPGCTACSSLEDSQRNHLPGGAMPLRGPPVANPGPGVGDFDLYPPPDGSNAYPQGEPGGQSDVPDSYLPWPSPPSRGQTITDMLRSVDNSLQLDPRLMYPEQFIGTGFAGYGPVAAGQFPVQSPVTNVPLKASCSPSPHCLAAPAEVEWPMGQTSAAATEAPPQEGQSSTRGQSASEANPTSGAVGERGGFPLSAAQRELFPGHDEGQDNGDSDDEEQEEEKPPKKRPRLSFNDDEFDDDQMPCPFHLLDPEFYSRSNQEKFSPCHTKHKDISTIVRHLARPAHRLDVHEAWISSFDVVGDRNHLPQAGLCRKCWRPFFDRGEFDRHCARPCARASRGKRQKFQLLYETFCLGAGQSQDQGQERSSRRLSSEAQEGGTPRTSREGRGSWTGKSRSPAVAAAAASPYVQPKVEEDRTVSLQEHLALVKRVEALEHYYEQMESILSPLQKPGRGTSASASASTSAKRARTAAPRRAEECLVGGMNSRCTDVNRDGFLPEIQRTFTGVSSSSDKSSVHYVSTNPEFKELAVEPGREGEEEGEGADGGGRRDRPAAEPSSSPATLLKTPRKQMATTFSEDSGYGGSSTRGRGRGSGSGSTHKLYPLPAGLEPVPEQGGAAAAAAAAAAGVDVSGDEEEEDEGGDDGHSAPAAGEGGSELDGENELEYGEGEGEGEANQSHFANAWAGPL